MGYSNYSSGGWRRDGRRLSRPRRRLSSELFKNLLLLASVLFIAGSLGVLGVFAYVSRDLPNPGTLTERSIRQSTKLYDRTGEHLLYEFFGDENRTLVKMQEGFCQGNPQLSTDQNGIPLFVLQATIAAEDRKFCSHHGFSFTGLLRAVLYRGSKGGGSTLTQQLVKNAILSNEKTLTRKAKELILSIELERRYSKDEILQIYFNEIPYGSTYYGIQAASLNYFGKEVNKLTLAEAATLAALPQAPTTYLNHPDRLVARRNWILDGMAELSFITPEQAAAAKTETTPVAVSVTNITAPHFVFFVKEQLEEKYGQRQVEEGGLKVITTLDYDKQTLGEKIIKDEVEKNGEAMGFTNAALVAIDPKTGQILAMIGSQDYFNDEIDGQVNVTTRLRQPGSSIKPIIYAKAFEMGYTPNTVLWDVKTVFPTATGNYEPNNYDLKERGPVRLRDALQLSLNIPAVKALYLVGVENALKFAESLGYSSFADRSRFGLAIVLGGGEVKLLEHTNAYATFSNDGLFHPTAAILKVEDPSGQVLEEWRETPGVAAMKPNTARLVSSVLSDNAARAPVFGGNNPLQLGARPVAAKTGTTNDYHDSWTVGYTPSLAVGVWGGNNNNDPLRKGAGGSTVAAPIWNAFMRQALEGQPIEAFLKPEIPTTGKDILDGKLQQTTVAIDRVTGKLATEYTPSFLIEQRTYAQYHNLLYYVNPSDPLGPPPSKPESDPHFRPWEDAVLSWLTKKEQETGIKITAASAPTEYDDLHIPANLPAVHITSPGNNSEVNGQSLIVDANAEAPRGISRVEYYLDGLYLGHDGLFPYRLATTLPSDIKPGYHTLRAVAYDDVGNSGSDTVGLRIIGEAAVANFSIVDPKNGQTIEKTASGQSFAVVVSLSQPSSYRSVTVFAQPIGLGEKQIIGAKINPDSPFLSFSWALPDSGAFAITAVLEDHSGNSYMTAGAVVQIVTSTTSPPPVNPDPNTTPPLPNLDPFAVTP